MDNYEKLTDKLELYIDLKEKNLLLREIAVEDITFPNLRDILLTIGDILEEDEADKIYISRIKSGIANKNSAIVAVLCKEDTLYIASSAKEGLINQHTAEKAIDKLESGLKN